MTARAHLVGGLAFETGEQAMRAVGENAPTAVDWVPDGETGTRRKWMSQHRARFEAQQALELKPVTMGSGISPETPGVPHGAGTLLFALEPGRTPEDVVFDTFGYADAADESFRAFSKLKADGVLRPETRFQVAMPTPFGIFTAFVHPDDREALRPAVERGMFADVNAITAAIPHDELAFQWDVAHEFGVLTGTHTTDYEDPLATVVENVRRAGEAIPADIPLAFHLCYGGAFDVHFLDPEDTGLMARVMSGVLEGLSRSIERFHLPVPIARDDVAYFEPLADVELARTELFLGLLHHEDGIEGAQRRIAAAKRIVPEFGVATECGTGRTLADPAALLRLHEQGAALAAAPAEEAIEPPRTPRPQASVDEVAVNDRIRRIAEQVPCRECGTPVGQPCNDDPTVRPHMDRYHEGLIGIVSGGLDWDEPLVPPGVAASR